MITYYLKVDGVILYEGKSEKSVDLHFHGKIKAGWRTRQEVLDLGLDPKDLEERLVVDREEIPANLELKDENNIVIQEASDLIPAVTHLQYFVPANYTIELEDEESSEYKLSHYAEFRAKEYPSIQEQLDLRFWDEVNGTTIWKDTISAIKAKYPKA